MPEKPQITRSTCPYCGVGCGVLIESAGQQITGVQGDPEHPANRGMLCSKGQSLHLTAASHVSLQNRLLQPQARSHRQAPLEPVTWEQATHLAATQLARVIEQHGPDALGFYISGQLLTEDYYVFNKLAKGLIGTNNLDSNSRLCMSSAVAAYKLTLGADAPPACYDDIDACECLFIAGSNTAWAHPILFRRIEQAKQKRPQMKMIVVDPRKTDTAAVADLHLGIEPGTDVMLFNGMLHIVLSQGWIDAGFMEAHTTGFDDLRAVLMECTPEAVAQICGIAPQDLWLAARWFSQSTATLSLYCQGLNQSTSGTANNAALIHLHLATGQIGKPGAGPLSLTGQPNAMGGREVGAMANLMSAHRDLSNAAHRQELSQFWGVDQVPAKPGLTAIEMFQAAADGQIKALWIACTNPAQSLPDQKTVRQALQKAEFVIVQEAFASAETCHHADLLLPASTWGEKHGTVTNSERCISKVNAAVQPPGWARHDWQIVRDIGQALVTQWGRPDLKRLLDYDHPESIWNEHRASTRDKDLDITGLSYEKLQHAPEQWPCSDRSLHGQKRLYTDGRFATPDGRARFTALRWKPLAEERRASHPFSLTTGRLRDQWHGMTRTGTAARLFAHQPTPQVQMNPADMARWGIASGDLVTVKSARGEINLPAQASDAIKPMQSFIAMHWGSQYLWSRNQHGQAAWGVNTLTLSDFCPTSKQPELKHSAVQITPSELQHAQGVITAAAWLPHEIFWQRRVEIQQMLTQLDMAYLVPFADPHAERADSRPRSGWHVHGRSRKALDMGWIHRLQRLLGLSDGSPLVYQDPLRHQFRTLQLGAPDTLGQRQLWGFALVGDQSSAAWLQDVLQQGTACHGSARVWLQASASAPQGLPPTPKQICNCLNVHEESILNQLKTLPHGLDPMIHLQHSLRCGTQCGSCRPEIQRLIQKTLKSDPVAEAP
jgi:assimilatory nitrate reductase catalytic subunit